MGELMAQSLGLGIDPHPRHPDAEILAPEGSGQEQSAGESSAFAVLAALKEDPPR